MQEQAPAPATRPPSPSSPRLHPALSPVITLPLPLLPLAIPPFLVGVLVSLLPLVQLAILSLSSLNLCPYNCPCAAPASATVPIISLALSLPQVLSLYLSHRRPCHCLPLSLSLNSPRASATLVTAITRMLQGERGKGEGEIRVSKKGEEKEMREEGREEMRGTSGERDWGNKRWG